MSHLKERVEKICLNCNAATYGRYCHVCGQENIETKESFWHLVTHFVYDITHFDGKFFSTLKYLLFRPGYLSQEYLIGRRTSYLHPIRMYVFTSAFFFLIFFSFYQKTPEPKTSTTASNMMEQLKKSKEILLKTSPFMPTPADKKELEQKIKDVDTDIALLEKDSTAVGKLKTISYKFNVISFKGDDEKENYKTLAQYDSLQKALPVNKRDGLFVSKAERQNLHLKEKYNNDGRLILKAISEKFFHTFPQMLFASLPLFALLLQLLYYRRKQFYYVNHVVYVIHLYCATFIIMLLSMWMGSLLGLLHINVANSLRVIGMLLNLFYWYKAMRNFYEQRRAKTIGKFLLLMLLSFFLFMILFVCFFMFSAMAI